MTVRAHRDTVVDPITLRCTEYVMHIKEAAVRPCFPASRSLTTISGPTAHLLADFWIPGNMGLHASTTLWQIGSQLARIGQRKVIVRVVPNVLRTAPAAPWARRTRLRSSSRTSARGAMPWGGVDPVVVSAQIINALKSIPSRQMDVTLAPAIVTVAMMPAACATTSSPMPSSWKE